MKKHLVSLVLFLCLGIGTPAYLAATNTAVPSESGYQSSSQTVTITKPNRSGAGGVRTKVEYKIENDKVYILYNGTWYEATYSDKREYTYMVDLGGRGNISNVYYFNL